jgi:NH3-dependent NAD+ synthetase
MIREFNVIKEQIKNFNLDLTNLVVITECASGFYAYNTFVPILATAKKVIAVSKTTSYGTFEENKKNIGSLAKKLNIDISNLEVVEKIEEYHLKEADIITNSGLVRPITAEMMTQMKNTAVIPLMWETWEFRESDLDLESAVKNDILVLGTKETSKEIDMRGYAGVLGLAVLVYLNLEVYKTKVVLFGNEVLGNAIAETFEKNNVEYLWFVNSPINENQKSYKELGNYKNIIKSYDVVLFAEHSYRDEILTKEHGLTLQDLNHLNEEIKIGLIAGNINQEELINSSLEYFPKKIMPAGYMSFQPYHMGAKPVIELFSAGLKIGEQMARCRLNGMSLEDTINFMTTKSFAMDFVGKSYMNRYKEIKGT